MIGGTGTRIHQGVDTHLDLDPDPEIDTGIEIDQEINTERDLESDTAKADTAMTNFIKSTLVKVMNTIMIGLNIARVKMTNKRGIIIENEPLCVQIISKLNHLSKSI